MNHQNQIKNQKDLENYVCRYYRSESETYLQGLVNFDLALLKIVSGKSLFCGYDEATSLTYLSMCILSEYYNLIPNLQQEFSTEMIEELNLPLEVALQGNYLALILSYAESETWKQHLNSYITLRSHVIAYIEDKVSNEDSSS